MYQALFFSAHAQEPGNEARGCHVLAVERWLKHFSPHIQKQSETCVWLTSLLFSRLLPLLYWHHQILVLITDSVLATPNDSLVSFLHLEVYQLLHLCIEVGPFRLLVVHLLLDGSIDQLTIVGVIWSWR